MKKYKIILSITYLLLAITGFATEYFYDSIPEILITKAKIGSVIDTVSYSGIVCAESHVIFSKQVAKVVAVYVNEGEYVRKGDLIARLDLNDKPQDFIEQQAQSITDWGISIGDQSLNDLLSSLTQSGQYNSVVASGAGIRAPSDGYITKILVKEGDYATSVSPICVISDQSKLSVRVQVAEDRISNIEIGQSAVVTGSGFAGSTYYGVVEKIASQATQSLLNNNGATVAVDISLSNPDNKIMPGFTATVRIRTGKRDNVIQVPLEAINQDDDGKEYVWIYQDGYVRREYLSCQYTSYGYAEVESFNVDQWIVAQGRSDMKEGTSVRVAQ